VNDDRTRRRRLLGAIAAAVAGGPLLAGCTGDGGARTVGPAADSTATTAVGETEPNERTFDGWLDGVDDADALRDLTGESAAHVRVGAEGNGGYLAFAPVVVRLSPGTTVTWRWTGRGGAHNVVAEDDSFRSRLTGSDGTTFSHAFEDAGTYRYACTPHESMGMKGVVLVE
jgi:halocyanin-like protein